MNRVEAQVRRFDRFQQRHRVLAIPWAVLQKSGNDGAGKLASRVAYHGLFSVFPLLLLFTTILGFVLHDDPNLQHHILDTALADFPIIGQQLRHNAHSLTGSALGLAVGIGGTVYGTFGLAQSTQAALNTVWNIPYVKWPNYFMRRLRGLAIFGVLGLAMLVSGALSAYAQQISGVGRPLGYAGSVLVNFSVFAIAFVVLTAEHLRLREVWLGVVLATAFWQVLFSVGSWYVGRELRHATPTYGFFAIVIALLSWMYLAAQLTLVAAEINVVLKHHLWPRSITQPPLTDADRRTFARLAAMEVRRPEYGVDLHLNPSADEDPLVEYEAASQSGDRGSKGSAPGGRLGGEAGTPRSPGGGQEAAGG